MKPDAWRRLGDTVETVTPEGDFAFLSDPLTLLSELQRSHLHQDLSELAKLRRDAEADGGSLRLA